MPELFPVLRGAIDEEHRSGRFLLLGSAAPELLRSTSESLAGRIVYTELAGLRLDELPDAAEIDVHWLRGGYPFAYVLAISMTDLTSSRATCKPLTGPTCVIWRAAPTLLVCGASSSCWRICRVRPSTYRSSVAR